jgi:hypothetical protein
VGWVCGDPVSENLHFGVPSAQAERCLKTKVPIQNKRFRLPTKNKCFSAGSAHDIHEM